MKKRILMIALAAVMGLTACSSETAGVQDEGEDDKFKIVSNI